MNKTFLLKSNHDTNLSLLECERIIIRKISSSSNNIHTLFVPIKIETKYPNGSEYSYFIAPIKYYSNTRSGIATDRPMSEKIRDCVYTKVIISPPQELPQDYELIFEYEPVTIIPSISILINTQIDGIVFGLAPQSKITLKQIFPNAIIARTILVDQTTKIMFEQQYGSVLPYVLRGLTGLDDDKVFSIGLVKIIDVNAGNKVILEYDPNRINE